MEKKKLKNLVQKLKDFIIPFEEHIKSKFIENLDSLECILQLWANFNKTQIEGMFNEQIEETKLNEIIKLLNV